MRRKLVIFIAALVFLTLLFVSMSSIAIRSIQLHLRAVGESIYAYHERTGRWPASNDDLATTNLSTDFPHALGEIEAGRLIVVWPKEMPARPADNAGRILVYNKRSFVGWFGCCLVCRGD
ncbi:MAG: hypothetical protein AB7K24_30740, partial [Gemmataceae bacterium]